MRPSARELKRAPVPLLLQSFPQPPSFIPPSPSLTSLNPPPSLPPATPLPPLPLSRPTSQASSAHTRSSIASSRSSTGPLLPRTPSVDDATKLGAQVHIRLPGDHDHSDDILTDFPKVLCRTPEPDDSIASIDIRDLPSDDHEDDADGVPAHAHALAVHRAVRARRSRSNSHKQHLRQLNGPDSPPPLPSTPLDKSSHNPDVKFNSKSDQQKQISEPRRQGAASPDISTIIDATPKPRRRSGPSSERSLSRSRSRARESAPSSVPSSRRTSKSTGIRSAPVPRRRASSPCKLHSTYSYDAQLTWDDLDHEAETRLERALEGGGSDSDSSLDLHTPLPHLMVRHGLLSPNSKLFPNASRPHTPSSVIDGRPGSIMSVASSVVTKSGIIKDERDTPGRRTRHRDGRLLRGGVGLTTGLGWSDSEDEDAPSLLTRRVSSLVLSRRSSEASLRASASMHSLKHKAAGAPSALPHYPSTLSHSGSTRSSGRHPLSRSYSSGSLLPKDPSLIEEDLLESGSDDEVVDSFAGYGCQRAPPTSWSGPKSTFARPPSKAKTSIAVKSTTTRISSASTSSLRASTSTTGSLRMPTKRSTTGRSAGSAISLALSIPESTAESVHSHSAPVTPGPRVAYEQDKTGDDTMRTPSSSSSSGSIPMPATPRDADDLTPTPTVFARTHDRSPMPEAWAKGGAKPKSIRVSESWGRNFGQTAARAVEDITRLLDEGYTKISADGSSRVAYDGNPRAYDSNKGLPPLPLSVNRDASPPRANARAALGNDLPRALTLSASLTDAASGAVGGATGGAASSSSVVGGGSSAQAHTYTSVSGPAASSGASMSAGAGEGSGDAAGAGTRPASSGTNAPRRQLVPPRPLQLLRTVAASTSPPSPSSPLTPLTARSSIVPPSPLTPTSMLSLASPPLTPSSAGPSTPRHLAPPASSTMTGSSPIPSPASSHHSGGTSYFSASAGSASPASSAVGLPDVSPGASASSVVTPGARLADRFAGQGLLKPKPRTGTGMAYRTSSVPSRVRAPGAPTSRMPTAKPVPF
ncbi:hypothetical protein HGRIS_012572 [Hohenbuehelia grisea]|uniref:Proteophosphoglycan ppg4 n=1 Tax=Hohenbuehelia grisea TaxID=104357 RepID=A0ABR3ISV1_9AGAR